MKEAVGLKWAQNYRGAEVEPEDVIYQSYGVRTDLAVEAQEVIVQNEGPPEIPGVRVENTETDIAKVTRLVIETDAGAQQMGKAKGTYVTIQSEVLRQRNKQAQAQLSELVAEQIEGFMKRLGVPVGGSVLVVGLGNWNATPDDVGPLSVSKLLVTRHLHEQQALPQDTLGELGAVSALAPGVLGLTGVETSEIVNGVVQKIHPDMVICLDALAAKSVDRLAATIQIADVGINPGSGVGNKRTGITQETMGVPVLAIGVPTVIYAMTMIAEAIDKVVAGTAPDIPPQPAAGVAPAQPQASDGGRRAEPHSMLSPANIRFEFGTPLVSPGAPVAGGSASMLNSPEQRMQIMQEVLGPFLKTMVVTPKEVDVLIDDASDVLSDALNQALHPGLSADDARLLR